MKVQVILPLSIAVSVASFALVKVRVREFAIDEKKLKFQDVKLRVTDDVLKEYVKEKQGTEASVAKEKKTQEELNKALTELNKELESSDLDECRAVKDKLTERATAAQEEVNKFRAESEKEKAAWEAEIADLQQKLNSPSPICQYVRAGSSLNECPEKKEEPKPEPTKPAEEEKKEAPKAEEEKKEASKAEEEKKEAPKAEEEKKEAPKAEGEPPKTEEKSEPAKPEEVKPAATKPEEVKPDAPKQEAPKEEAPKQ